jgi:hypothetical protein
MTDYAAAAVQPIVQGLITVSALGGVLSFAGRGASLVPSATGVGRDGVNAQGVIVLTLDKGLPGNAGAVEPVPAPVTTPPLVAPFAPLPRTLISARSPGAGAPTLLESLSATYGNFTVPAPADGSLTQVEIVLALGGGGLADPFPPNAAGVEVIVWAGVESP